MKHFLPFYLALTTEYFLFKKMIKTIICIIIRIVANQLVDGWLQSDFMQPVKFLCSHLKSHLQA